MHWPSAALRRLLLLLLLLLLLCSSQEEPEAVPRARALIIELLNPKGNPSVLRVGVSYLSKVGAPSPGTLDYFPALTGCSVGLCRHWTITLSLALPM